MIYFLWFVFLQGVPSVLSATCQHWPPPCDSLVSEGAPPEQGPKLWLQVPSASVCSGLLSPLEAPGVPPQDVLHLAFHPSCREEAAGLEEVVQWAGRSGRGRAERARGEMVWESREEFSEEAEENRPARWAGESDHHAELQHQVCHHPQVSSQHHYS